MYSLYQSQSFMLFLLFRSAAVPLCWGTVSAKAAIEYLVIVQE